MGKPDDAAEEQAWLASLKDGDVVGCVMLDGTTREGHVVPEGVRPDAVRVMCSYGYWTYSRTTGVLKTDAHLGNPRRIVPIEPVPRPTHAMENETMSQDKDTPVEPLRELLTAAGVGLPSGQLPLVLPPGIEEWSISTTDQAGRLYIPPPEEPAPSRDLNESRPELTYGIAAMMFGDALTREGLGCCLLARFDDSIRIRVSLGDASGMAAISMSEAIILADWIEVQTRGRPIWRLDDHRLRERCQAMAREVKARLPSKGDGATGGGAA